MRWLFVIAALALSACGDQSATAQTATQAPKTSNASTHWTMDKSKSVLSFSAVQSGEAFTGTFERFDAQISFDPNNLAAANVVVSVDLKSADAGDMERTEALPGKEWFYVKKFPTAKFETTSFTHKGGTSYEAAADLTIRGTTQQIVLPFTLAIEGGHASMLGSLTLNRRDYNVGTGMWKSEDWADHSVGVNIALEADLSIDK